MRLGSRVLVRTRASYLVGLRVLLVIGVLASIWFPELLHFYINRDQVAIDAVSQSIRSPASSTLDEIARMTYAVRIDTSSLSPTTTAEEIVQGKLHAPGFLDKPMPLSGYPNDFMAGPPTFQLGMASLAVENILLQAFELSRDDRFLKLALGRTLSLAQYERKQFWDVGFLWNDHAVSARIAVLARLWRNVRERSDIPIESLREILSFVSRSGRLLAKPDLFTVRTNHGVMQNLALLQISAAFPMVPESGSWRLLAFERLNIQLPFYVSKEGMVLEHSAEYHLFGTELLSMAIRLSVLNGVSPDQALIDAHKKAELVLTDLIRPDGTLPAFGNTSVGSVHSLPSSVNNGQAPLKYLLPPYPVPLIGGRSYPLSGYAVWWSLDSAGEIPNQALVAWAKHDGHGHKHADEGSFLLWSGGIEWITNTGYWPYGNRLTDFAYSWNASNAPHEMGESTNSIRDSKMLATGQAEYSRFIEVERRNVNGASFRRQVLQLDQNTFAVLDFSSKQSKGTETVWTVGPFVKLEPFASGIEFLASHTTFDHRDMAVSFHSVPGANIKTYRGSETPFSGWVVVDGRPTPSDAIRIVQPAAESVTASVFRINSKPMGEALSVVIEPSVTAEKWRLAISSGTNSFTVSRESAAIKIQSGAVQDKESVVTLVLVNEASVNDERRLLQQAYAKAISIYPPWYDFYDYRVKLSVLVLALGVLIEIVLFAFGRRYRAMTHRQSVVVHSIAAISWLFFCVWATGYYLQK